MTKKLFPEYIHYQVRNYYSMSDYVFQLETPDGLGGDGFNAIELLIEKGYEQDKEDFDGKGYSIYWLEFIIFYLFPKLNEKCSILDILYSGIHPIDRLYQEFSK